MAGTIAIKMTDKTPTATEDTLPRRFSDFATLGEALDYAATGARGLNFHDARGKLARPYPYSRAARRCAGACPSADRARRQAGRPHRARRRNRPRFRGAVLRRDLCRRLAGAAAAADLVRRDANPMSTSSASSSTSCDPGMLFFPAELAAMAGEAARLNGVEGIALGGFRASAPRRRLALPAARRPTTSPICNIRADRRASRTASRSRTMRCSTIFRPMRTAWSCVTATAASRGCPGITTWGWSAASSRRSPTRSRPTI